MARLVRNNHCANIPLLLHDPRGMVNIFIRMLGERLRVNLIQWNTTTNQQVTQRIRFDPFVVHRPARRNEAIAITRRRKRYRNIGTRDLTNRRRTRVHIRTTENDDDVVPTRNAIGRELLRIIRLIRICSRIRIDHRWNGTNCHVGSSFGQSRTNGLRGCVGLFVARTSERPDEHGKTNETTHPATVTEMHFRCKMIGFQNAST